MGKRIRMNYKYGSNIFYMLLPLSMAFPTLFTAFKIFVIFVMIFLMLIIAVEEEALYIEQDLIVFSLFFSIFGLLYALYGLLNNNPGALKTATVMVIYPVLFTLIACFFRDKEDLLKFFDVLIFSCLLVVSVQIAFILSAYGVLPNNLAQYFSILHPGNAVLDLGENDFLFILPNVSSLLFLIPFLASYILLTLKINYKLVALLGVMLILIFLTGRRAFFVSFFISFVFLYFVLIVIRKSLHTEFLSRFLLIGFLLLTLILMVVLIGNVSLDVYVSKFNSIFNFSSNVSNLERLHQFNSLMESIYEAPLLGHGAGAVAGYLRSDTQPWAYELSYIALIFQYGIFGFLLYFLGVLYIVYTVICMCVNSYVDREVKIFSISFLTGMISFLVANATNPYLSKFDYMWVLFIPVFFINIYRLNKYSLFK